MNINDQIQSLILKIRRDQQIILKQQHTHMMGKVFEFIQMLMKVKLLFKIKKLLQMIKKMS